MQHFFKTQWQIKAVLAGTALFFIPTLVARAGNTFQPTGTTFQPQGSTFQPSNSFVLENPLAHGSTLCELLNAVFNVALTLGIPIMVVFMVLAGFQFVTALGNPTKLTKAKWNIYYTIIGIALFIGAWFFAQVIANTLVQLGGSSFNTCF